MKYSRSRPVPKGLSIKLNVEPSAHPVGSPSFSDDESFGMLEINLITRW